MINFQIKIWYCVDVVINLFNLSMNSSLSEQEISIKYISWFGLKLSSFIIKSWFTSLHCMQIND